MPADGPSSPAPRWLADGWTIHARRLRTPAGEVDAVAEKPASCRSSRSNRAPAWRKAAVALTAANKRGCWTPARSSLLSIRIGEFAACALTSRRKPRRAGPPHRRCFSAQRSHLRSVAARDSYVDTRRDPVRYIVASPNHLVSNVTRTGSGGARQRPPPARPNRALACLHARVIAGRKPDSSPPGKIAVQCLPAKLDRRVGSNSPHRRYGPRSRRAPPVIGAHARLTTAGRVHHPDQLGERAEQSIVFARNASGTGSRSAVCGGCN